MTNRHLIALNKRRVADMTLLVLLAGIASLYCFDAARASTHIYNLIMVLPLSIAIFILCTVQFVAVLRSESIEAEEAREPTGALPVIVLFSLYVLSLNWLGFDVGTAMFVGVFLWVHGERRWPWLIGYSVVFAFVLTFFFSQMLPYPMPMLLPGLANAYPF